MPEDGLYEAMLPCRDATGRQRDLQVVETRLGEISIIVPPGQSATVTADQVEAVRRALDEARTRAMGRQSS